MGPVLQLQDKTVKLTVAAVTVMHLVVKELQLMSLITSKRQTTPNPKFLNAIKKLTQNAERLAMHFGKLLTVLDTHSLVHGLWVCVSSSTSSAVTAIKMSGSALGASSVLSPLLGRRGMISQESFCNCP